MTLKISTATGTVWTVARLPWQQLGFLVLRVTRYVMLRTTRRLLGVAITL